MIVKGPFSVKWGDNVLAEIEEIAVDYSVDSEEIQTVQGQTLELDGAHKAAVSITLLASDIPALAAVLPQYFVANGQVLSTGETVSHAQGAIDVVPHACDQSTVYNNLDIIACGTQADVVRLVNARSKMDSISVDGKIRKVVVKFVGEPATDEATVQFFRNGTINVVS